MKEWPKYFLHRANKHGIAYWKFKDSSDIGTYFYSSCGSLGKQESVYSAEKLLKEDPFMQVSEEELTLLLLEQ